MTDIVVGILAVGAGLMLCFVGYWTLRLLLSIWGGVVGFGLGSALGTWINDDSYLATALGWIVGFVLALIFAALAYLYYSVAIVVSFGSMGFTLGAAVTAATGVSWDWVIVGIGLVSGLVLALLAIVARLPLMLLILLSSFGGRDDRRGGHDAADRCARYRRLRHRDGHRDDRRALVVVAGPDRHRGRRLRRPVPARQGRRQHPARLGLLRVGQDARVMPRA